MNTFEFDVEIKYTRRKGSIGIRIQKNGVCLLAPYRTPQSTLKQLVKDRQDWIREKLTLLKCDQEPSADNQLSNGMKIAFLGNEHVLHIHSASRNQVTLRNNQLWVELKEQSTKYQSQLCLKLLEEWYQQQAESYLNNRLQHLSNHMGLPYASLKVRSYKSRWGSCDRYRRITLNSRLIMASVAIIDYVIIHELSHLVHLNHSPEFWRLVEQYCPDYLQKRRWLRNQGHKLSLPE
ncbi:M48 family metallopeptidase [Motiliproteus sp. MSK22-1]|uniref:M48 family metallopeptidase n=1 Tax=Motiliproteus sp. MSK22-1 TaxID=1897630 RepID=UPI000976EDF9|nr:SprT family zinc-dependent metalloprotease [Motiliproteus sp. MSK22-1]OMH25869.1 hypothetical protein BGP75_25495 [Motiliproteus sp. MSK22-1]